MLARDWMIIIVLFGAVVGICFLVASDIAGPNGYNNTGIIDEDFQSNYDTLTNISSDIYTAQNATASGEGLSTTSTFNILFKSTFSVISIVFKSFGIVNQVFVSFAEDFGIPSGVANIFFSAILVIAVAIIIFVVISSVSQGRL